MCDAHTPCVSKKAVSLDVSCWLPFQNSRPKSECESLVSTSGWGKPPTRGLGGYLQVTKASPRISPAW